MKKILKAIGFIAIVVALFTSCKTREKCPAYGKVPKQPTEQNC